MGFFIRKSVKVGPLRFNISNGGVGVSTGFKGFRIGTGPRGNYVQVGLGGFYYKKTYPIQSDLKNNNSNINDQFDDRLLNLSQTHSTFYNNETTNFLTLHDAEQDDFVKELNEKSKVPKYWLYGLISLIILNLLYLITGVSFIITIIVNFLAALGIYYLYILTELKKSTVIMYDFTDENSLKKYESIVDSIVKVNTSQKIWLLQSRAEVYDSKYHAGAGHLVNRKIVSISKDTDRYIKTNVDIYALKLDHKIIYLFPDKLILKTNNNYGVIPYRNIKLEISDYQFIEDDSIPSDGEIIDRTWQYVNRKGGPDRRFKNNKQLPVLKYELLTITSKSGLYEQLVFSKLGNSRYLKESIKNID